MNLSPISTRNPKLSPIMPYERKANLCKYMLVRANDIYLSVSLLDSLSNPEFVEFAMDETMKCIAIKKSDSSSEYAMELKTASGGKRIGKSSVIANLIIKMLEFESQNILERHNIRLFQPTRHGEYIVFNLNKAEIEDKKKRGNKNENIVSNSGCCLRTHWISIRLFDEQKLNQVFKAATDFL